MSAHNPVSEALAASGRSAEKLSLPLLQSKMKCDPDGYNSELVLLYNQFNSSLELFQQQAALNYTSVSGVAIDSSVAKDLGDRALFLAHVTPFYPNHLSDFPKQLSAFLLSAARSLPSGLRVQVTQALILLVNRKIVDIGETMKLFMDLQTLGDKTLKKLAFSHVIQCVRRMNKQHKNEAKNRSLQNILFTMVQQEDERKSKRALITLCEFHRRKVWFDERTANAICTACFHSSPRIMISALSFLLDYEKIECDGDSDASSSDDESTPQTAQALFSREAVYKANHQGTMSSKKKKKAKLQRAIRSMKKQQRVSSEKHQSNYYSPLNHLKDPQGFAEKLLSCLQTSTERFEVKMMMLKVIARTVGLHRLILLNFYTYIQKYAQPHQRDITNILAAAVQACHDMVPPDAIEPLFKQIVNQFVHDRSRTEAIAVGLNVVREICLRVPLLMTEELLQDLVLYKKSHEKAISAAARSLVTLFREVCPSLLVKKDRGRPSDPKAKPKAYGEVSVVSNIPGLELLEESDNGDIGVSDDESLFSDQDNDTIIGDEEEIQMDVDDLENEYDDGNSTINDDTDEDVEDDDSSIDESEEVEEAEQQEDEDDSEEEEEHNKANLDDAGDSKIGVKESNARKRKLSDFDGQLVDADKSLRALKRLAEEKMKHVSSDSTDGILSNEDFKRIKELKAKKEAKLALNRHGLMKNSSDAKPSTFKVPSADKLSMKPMDPSKLEAHLRNKLNREERLALVRAGREDRGKYQARAAVKQKKTGGLSNRQKEHKKAMPLAAKRSKVAKSRVDKKKKQQRAGKQFRGRKAWK